MRTIPEISNDQIITEIKKLVADINNHFDSQLEFKLLGNKIPVITDPDDEFVSLIKDAAERKLNFDFPLHSFSGGTDASELVKANPQMNVVVFGPGSNTSHQENEYVELNQFNYFIDIYKDIIKRFFKVQ